MPTNIKEIPKKTLTIGNSVYKFQCMIVHWGNLDDELGHYTATVRKNDKYILANDGRITVGIKWPTNCYEEKVFEGKLVRCTPSVLFYNKVR